MSRSPWRRAARLAGRLAGSVAAIALTAAAPPPEVPAAQVTPAFRPPGTPMLLTRTLRRPLADGKELVNRRSYAVRFVPDGQGFRIDGKLVAVEVEVPPPLQALADIERARPDEGLFPILLDAGGLIAPENDPRAPEAMGKAIDEAKRALGQSGMSALDMLEAQAFVERFRNRPAMSPWPRDLFRPARPETHLERSIPLPDGKAGMVRIDTEAAVIGPSGLLVSFRRTVTTELDGVQRFTVETWTLEPLK